MSLLTLIVICARGGLRCNAWKCIKALLKVKSSNGNVFPILRNVELFLYFFFVGTLLLVQKLKRVMVSCPSFYFTTIPWGYTIRYYVVIFIFLSLLPQTVSATAITTQLRRRHPNKVTHLRATDNVTLTSATLFQLSYSTVLSAFVTPTSSCT